MWLKCFIVNSIGRIEIKWVKIVNEIWQGIIKNLTTECDDTNNTKDEDDKYFA